MEPTSYKDIWNVGDIIRAPGKIVLAGEYAILDGAPAIVLAINRGVECEIAEGTGFETPMNDTRFVAHAKPVAKERRLIFRDWNPVTNLPSHHKPGFGGSGAACIIATRLMDLPWSVALQTHRDVQGGGSGIDVKASIMGGMFIWEPSEERTQGLVPLHPVVVWTGQSAKTGPRVQQYMQYENREWFVRNSIRFTQQFLDDPVKGTKSLYKNLSIMSREAGIEYVTPAIETIVQWAEECGGAAKPSGAGGGDCAVAFFNEPEHQREFIDRITEHPTFSLIEYEVSEGIHIVRNSN